MGKQNRNDNRPKHDQEKDISPHFHLSAEQTAAIERFSQLIGDQIANLIKVILLEGVSIMSSMNPGQTGQTATNGLMTAKEVSGILNVSQAAVYRLIEEGDLPSIRFGRTVRVMSEDLDQYILAHRTEKME